MFLVDIFFTRADSKQPTGLALLSLKNWPRFLRYETPVFTRHTLESPEPIERTLSRIE